MLFVADNYVKNTDTYP